jgi:hypothetical protein
LTTSYIPVYAKQYEEEWHQYKKQFMIKYKMKDLGDAEWILGMKITRDRKKKYLSITQEQYVKGMLKQFDMEMSKAARTPGGSYKLSKKDCPATIEEARGIDKNNFEAMVGSLLYATISTRPDIAHAVSVVCRYMQNPGKNHIIACKRIIRYLRGTTNMGLEYYGDNVTDGELHVKVYSDADWAGDHRPQDMSL